MTRNRTILLALALLLAPALACQTLLGGAPTPPPIPEIPTIEVPDIQVTVPDIDVTVPAIPTLDLGGEAPADVPIVSENTNLFASQDAISYETTMPAEDVVNFYKTEMVAQGWAEAAGNVSLGSVTVLNYTKENRAVVVTITDANGSVSVLIAITGS